MVIPQVDDGLSARIGNLEIGEAAFEARQGDQISRTFGPREPVDDVVALLVGIECERVLARAAEELVVAVSALQPIGATGHAGDIELQVAVEKVVAIGAVEEVVALDRSGGGPGRITVKNVVTGGAEQVIVRTLAAADHHRIAIQRIVAVIAFDMVVAALAGERADTADQRIIAGIARYPVVASATACRVIASTSGYAVIAVKRVVAQSPIDVIVAITAVNLVVPRADLVRSAEAAQLVGLVVTDDRVRLIGAFRNELIGSGINQIFRRGRPYRTATSWFRWYLRRRSIRK